MAEILVVDDQEAIREGLATLLSCEGYDVRTAADGAAALEQVRARRPDLVLLDVMMPRKNGFAVCTELRQVDAELPVVFLTARGEDVDVLRGFGCGADDYVSKTTAQPQLLARIAAVLRRSARASDEMARGGGFHFGEWRVDVETLQLVSPKGARENLTVREVELLRYFRSHCGEVVSRDFLITRFWGIDFDGDESTLSVAMSRLRGKLGASGARLQTVYGHGYRFAMP